MKVFSLEKFIDSCIKDGVGTCAKEVLERNTWAVDCHHLTGREMGVMGYLTHEDWMVEIPDTTPMQATSESAASQTTTPADTPMYGGNRVGDVVEIQGIPCRIEPREWCEGCILTEASADLCNKYACSFYQRDDAKDVSFVRVK